MTTQEFHITSLAGRKFTVQVTGKGIFSVNGAKCELQANNPRHGKCLCFISAQNAQRALGVPVNMKINEVCIRISDSDYNTMNQYVVECKKNEQTRIDTIPSYYQITYDGHWADFYHCATKVILLVLKNDENNVITVNSKSFPEKSFKTEDCLKMAKDFGYEHGEKSGFMWVNVPKEIYETVLSRCENDVKPMARKRR